MEGMLLFWYKDMVQTFKNYFCIFYNILIFCHLFLWKHTFTLGVGFANLAKLQEDLILFYTSLLIHSRNHWMYSLYFLRVYSSFFEVEPQFHTFFLTIFSKPSSNILMKNARWKQLHRLHRWGNPERFVVEFLGKMIGSVNGADGLDVSEVISDIYILHGLRKRNQQVHHCHQIGFECLMRVITITGTPRQMRPV